MENYYEGAETERLIIRKLTEIDLPVWAEFFEDTDSFDYIGLQDEKELPVCDHSRKWIDRQFKRYRENDYGLMALIDKGTMSFIGQAGIITMNIENPDELEIGYHIISKHRGSGYATEAAIYFRDFAFSLSNIKSVITVIHENNDPSIKVALKLGMNKIKKTSCFGNPSFLYRIYREDWRVKKR